MYTITKARFDGVKFVQAADMGGTLLKPMYVLLHYTGGTRDAGALDTLTRKDETYVSAHLVVGATGAGEVTQCVPFDRQAWHAGKSAWRGRQNLNYCTIGIEMVNPGFTSVQWGPGRLHAAHKHGGPFREWGKYPAPQVESVAQVVASLFRYYGSLSEILGHDDVAPGRKWDPGPAFHMDAFRARVLELVRAD